MKKGIAFFDFDGTITKQDTLILFIKYAVGSRNYYRGLFLLSPVLILYIFKILSNNYAKERLIAYFFRGWEVKHFQKIAKAFALEEIDKVVYKDALKRIQWHIQKGHQVVVVSASIECWIEPWCERSNLALIGTKLSSEKGILNGKFDGLNCFGNEKKNRVLNLYNLEEFLDIYAYGDSKGDKELLEIADKSYYKIFKH